MIKKKDQNKNFVKKRISWITKYFGGSDPMNELIGNTQISQESPHFFSLHVKKKIS